MSTRSSWLPKLALAFASLLLVVGVSELALRWASARNVAAQRDAKEARQALLEGLLEAQSDLPVLHGTMAISRPNARGIHKGVFVRTDDHGFRGPVRGPVEPGVVRIVTVGDSFTFGSGAAEADVYGQQLEALLDRDRPGERHEVINAGLSGGHVDSVMNRLEDTIAAYRPGLYVYGYSLNDIEGRDYEILAADTRNRELLSWAANHPLLVVRFAALRLLTASQAATPAEEAYPRELSRNYLENEAAWTRVLRGLDRFKALADEAGVCGHLLLHTHLQHLGDDHPFLPLYARVAEAARARGLTVTDPFPGFAGRDPVPLWISWVDSHPNAEGHRILAEQLALDLLALPDRCWRRAEQVTQAQGRG